MSSPQAVATRPADPTYALGRSHEEYERLTLQSQALAPMSRRFLEAAGLTTGMRVLDVGCGVGDVSMLAAELVGPTGSVLGVDIDGNALNVARDRVANAGLSRVSFAQADFRELAASAAFDAVIGRLVLMYLADPVLGLRRVSQSVRPGGIVAFQEIDLGVAPVSVPGLDLWDTLVSTIAGTFQAAHCHVQMARELPLVFASAGLEPAGTTGEFLISSGDGAMFEWATRTYRSLYPLAVANGVVDPSDAGPDSFVDRLRAELRRTRHAYWSPFFVGAYATMPA